MKKVKVIYIIGSWRSGSTLLDRVLGSANNSFNVGELMGLEDYVLERDLISTGKKVFIDNTGNTLRKSPFWSDVVREIEENNYDMYNRYLKIPKKDYIKIIFNQAFRVKKFDDDKIFESILKKAKKVKGENVEYIIDSSKSLKRLASLKESNKIDLSVIHLIRDARGNINSYEKSGNNWFFAFKKWVIYNFLVSKYLNKNFKKEKTIRLSYDLFAQNPQKYIEKLNLKFDLLIDQNNYIDTINNSNYYGFCGNKMGKNKISSIKYDRGWENRMSMCKRIFLWIITFPFNKIWVYNKNK